MAFQPVFTQRGHRSHKSRNVSCRMFKVGQFGSSAACWLILQHQTWSLLKSDAVRLYSLTSELRSMVRAAQPKGISLVVQNRVGNCEREKSQGRSTSRQPWASYPSHVGADFARGAFSIVQNRPWHVLPVH